MQESTSWERTLGAAGSAACVEAVADALVTSRRLEPPCWLVTRRILADEWLLLLSLEPAMSVLEESLLREDFAGGMWRRHETGLAVVRQSAGRGKLRESQAMSEESGGVFMQRNARADDDLIFCFDGRLWKGQCLVWREEGGQRRPKEERRFGGQNFGRWAVGDTGSDRHALTEALTAELRDTRRHREKSGASSGSNPDNPIIRYSYQSTNPASRLF